MKRICVFCGAKMGARAAYAQAATGFGTAMAARGIGLVYGGTSIGLMGKVADAVLAGGGEAIGVLPAALKDKEIAHLGLTKLHMVESLSERKQLMFDLSDGFAALPGGLGTLDEMSEMLTWAQLGFHSKPVGLLNVEGYYDSLLEFLGNATNEGLLKKAHLELLSSEVDAGTLLDRMHILAGAA
jgi:hypothetical protein